MVCKFGCPLAVSFADSFQESLDDFMTYSSIFQRRDRRGREFSVLDALNHALGQIRAKTVRDRRRVPGG